MKLGGNYYLYNIEWQEVCIGCDNLEVINQHIKELNLDPNIYIIITAEFYWSVIGKPLNGFIKEEDEIYLI